ncbi:MAG: hypothetical protein ABIH69_03435 [bacterium]
MKNVMIVFLLLLVLASTCLANPKSWLDENSDKIGHGLLGGTVAGLSYKRGSDASGMILSAALVGLLKEAFDLKYSGKWDNWDWLATILGGVAVAII